MDRIRNLRWVKGSVLPEADQMNMTEQEMQYFADYNKMLANYMRQIGGDDYGGLDLTEHMEPPKSHMVYVRTGDIHITVNLWIAFCFVVSSAKGLRTI